jgi:hypothetical protein
MTDDIVALDVPEWEGVPAALRHSAVEALEALRVHRDGLKRVLTIGKFFEELQLEAMHRSHSNNPQGIRYNEAYAWLEKPVPQLAERTPTNPRGINKTDRNQFIWCWQHRVELDEWWATKEQHRRDRWNHPDAIKRNYQADTDPKERAAKPTGSAVTVDPGELDYLKRKAAREERGETGNPATDNPQAAGDAMYEQILQETKQGAGAALKRALAYANQIIKRVKEAERNLAKGKQAEVIVRKK